MHYLHIQVAQSVQGLLRVHSPNNEDTVRFNEISGNKYVKFGKPQKVVISLQFVELLFFQKKVHCFFCMNFLRESCKFLFAKFDVFVTRLGNISSLLGECTL